MAQSTSTLPSAVLTTQPFIRADTVNSKLPPQQSVIGCRRPDSQAPDEVISQVGAASKAALWLPRVPLRRAMRVIFLDIDGVICCNMHGELEASKLAHLRTIVDATSAKVVLSSDWRRIPHLKQRCLRTLSENRVEVIGMTPELAILSRVRPKEISMWLHDNQEAVTEWCCIDDRDLLAEEGGAALTGRMVRTEFLSGLTAQLAGACIDILAPPRADGDAESSSAATAAVATKPPLASVPALLHDAGVGHLLRYLEAETFEGLYAKLDSSGRVALLAHLKACGVHRLGDRQAVANALARARREGRTDGATLPPAQEPEDAEPHVPG